MKTPQAAHDIDLACDGVPGWKLDGLAIALRKKPLPVRIPASIAISANIGKNSYQQLKYPSGRVKDPLRE